MNKNAPTLKMKKFVRSLLEVCKKFKKLKRNSLEACKMFVRSS